MLVYGNWHPQSSLSPLTTSTFAARWRQHRSRITTYYTTVVLLSSSSVGTLRYGSKRLACFHGGIAALRHEATRKGLKIGPTASAGDEGSSRTPSFRRYDVHIVLGMRRALSDPPTRSLDYLISCTLYGVSTTRRPHRRCRTLDMPIADVYIPNP